MTLRSEREAKALAFLRLRRQASAVEIGSAAVKGEKWAGSPNVWRAKQEIGLQLAIELVSNGKATATRSNEFRIAN
jgi:hypothetical protein